MTSHILFLVIPTLLSIWKLFAGLKQPDNPDDTIILRNSSIVGVIFYLMTAFSCALGVYFLHKLDINIHSSLLVVISAALIFIILFVSYILDKFSVEVNHEYIVQKMAFAREKKLYWKDIVSVKYNSSLKAIEIKGDVERIMISEFYTGYQDLIVFLANKGLYM